jgi:hypothetical protein
MTAHDPEATRHVAPTRLYESNPTISHRQEALPSPLTISVLDYAAIEIAPAVPLVSSSLDTKQGSMIKVMGKTKDRYNVQNVPWDMITTKKKKTAHSTFYGEGTD